MNIGIDETSYRKGHKYITVVVNHDTNTVVWVADGHGKSVLEQFYKCLTDKQLASIKVVTGDGARWITDCVNEFTPECERCVDPFHVVEWAMDALDEVRRDRWRAAYEKAQQLSKDNPQKRGRPKSDDKVAAKVQAAKAKASEIKNSSYTLGKAPEHLTENQQIRLDMIQANDPQLYRAYCLKESLRLLLKSTDVKQAEADLKHWLWWASHSRIPAFKELYKKIKRHKEHILNTIRLTLGIVRDQEPRDTTKVFIGMHVAEQPAFRLRAAAKFCVGITAAWEHRYKQIRRISGSSYRICDRERSACPVNFHGIAGLMVDPHSCLGFPGPAAIDLAELGVLIGYVSSTGAFNLILFMKQGKVDTFFCQFFMDVGAIRLHVDLGFLKPFRIEQFIEFLVAQFLSERPADAFLLSETADIPHRVAGTMDRRDDLGVVVLEAQKPQDFAIIYHDHRP